MYWKSLSSTSPQVQLRCYKQVSQGCVLPNTKPKRVLDIVMEKSRLSALVTNYISAWKIWLPHFHLFTHQHVEQKRCFKELRHTEIATTGDYAEKLCLEVTWDF